VLLLTCIVAVFADDTVSAGDNETGNDTALTYSTTLVSGSYYGWGGSEVVLPGSQNTPVTGPYYGWGGSEVVLPGSEGTGWHATKDLIHAQAQPSSGTTMNGAAWKSPSDLIRAQTGQVRPPHNYNETNNGQTITGLVTGDVVIISLPENPTTGFSWNMTLSPGIALLNSTYIRTPVAEGIAGSGGTHVWTLSMQQAGTQTIAGVYKQPWMPTSDNDITYNLTFSVKGLGQY